MCLKAQPSWQMPEETGEIGAKILGENNVYRLVGDELFTLFTEADFADVYSEEGKLAISPVILGFVTIFHNLEKYPNQQSDWLRWWPYPHTL